MERFTSVRKLEVLTNEKETDLLKLHKDVLLLLLVQMTWGSP